MPIGTALAPNAAPRSARVPDGMDDPAWPQHRRRLLRVVGALVIGIWLIGLGIFSTLLYHRFFLSEDFATYNQAWTLIGQGHLNPFDTVYNSYTFLKSDLELILWPLALLHVLYPQPVVLLWVQDVAVAATGLVTYLWIIEFLEQQRIAWWTSVGVAVVVLLALVANPGVYQTLLFDFHLEPISTLFIVLAGHDLWKGRHGRAWIWVGIVLMCGSFAAITLIGLGLSAVLAGRDTRRHGVLLILVAIVWLGLISIVGANAGSGLNGYAYLAGRLTLPGSAGVAVVATGALTHPSRVFDQLHSRLYDIYVLIKPVGVIGLVSAWGFGVPVVVMVTNALNSSNLFIDEAFQNSAVFPFVLLGTVMVLVWIAQHVRLGWVPCLLVALVVTIQAMFYGFTTSPSNIRWAVSQVGTSQAAQLQKALALAPQNVEVVVSMGVIGRFCSRQYCYWYHPNAQIPVMANHVLFVFDPAVDSSIPDATSTDATIISYVRTQLHARQLIDQDGISAFAWQPKPGIPSIDFPRATHP
jgi:hypothetical protein